MSETALAHRLTIWSDQLLDVTLRNPLLSLRSNAGLPVWSDPWDLLGMLIHERARMAEHGRLETNSLTRAGASGKKTIDGHRPITGGGGIEKDYKSEREKIEANSLTWPDGILIVPYPITLLGTTGALTAWSGKDWSNGLSADAPLGSWLYQNSPSSEAGDKIDEIKSLDDPSQNMDDESDEDGEGDENTTLGDIQAEDPNGKTSGAVSARRRSRQQAEKPNIQRIMEHAGRLTRDARVRNKTLKRLIDWTGTKPITLPIGDGSERDRGQTKGLGSYDRDRDVLVVDGSPETLQGHLTRLDRVCRQKEEDHGVHTLFLACGLVRWVDPTGSSRMAPLVLVPVRLIRADAHSPWAIEPHADRPRINPALKHLLASKNQVDLIPVQQVLDNLIDQGSEPDLSPGIRPRLTGKDVARATLNALQGCSEQMVALWDEGRLVVASYARHAMWADLQERRALVAQHPLVQRLAGDEAAVALSAPEDDEQARQAWATGETLALPLPADASQRAAIARAANERTEALVIQGPPGTGKSQTIANLIAHLMDQGRSVLFVSEKLTALDVVHQRLIEAGLGDFCLELHTRSEQASHLAQRLSETLDTARRNGINMVTLNNAVSDERRKERSEMDRFNENQRATVLDQSVAFLHQTAPEHRDSLFSLIGQWMEAHVRWDLPGIPSDVHRIKESMATDGSTAWRAWLGGRDRDLAVERAETTWLFLNKHKIETGPSLETHVIAASEAWQTLDIWAQQRPDIRETLLHNIERGNSSVLTLAQHLKQARTFPSDWIEAWIEAEQRVDAQNLWGALDEWVQARAQWEQCWAPWAKLFTMDVVTAKDTVWQAWEDAQHGLGQWFRQRAWRRAVYQWERPGTNWADWVRWSWERNAVQAAFFAVKTAGIQLENQAKANGVNAPGQGRGKVDTTVLTAMATWGTQCGGYVQKARANSALLTQLWNAELHTEQGENIFLDQAYQRLIPWLCLSRDLTSKHFTEDEQQSVWNRVKTILELTNQACAHRSEIEQRMTWRTEIQEAGSGLLLDWWESRSEEAKRQIRLRPDETWAGWQAGQKAQQDLEEHTDMARALGGDRDSLITLYREFLMGENRRARQQVADGLLARAHGLTGSPEAALLAREALRRRPIGARALLRQLPTLTPLLLPCMMMSPLSAAEYLPPERKFDVVIFDEASQIAIGDAIGTVSRGRSVIVVGDDKQMPPTSVFAGSAADTTSILDECIAAGVPRAMLTWHYRSQQERLIAFSNTTYYHGDLMTFPDARVGSSIDPVMTREGNISPKTHEEENLEDDLQVDDLFLGRKDGKKIAPPPLSVILGGGGLYVHEVNGLYDRGGSGTNHDEAVAIVDAMTRHMEQQSHETIGVITFNRKQQILIEDLWDLRLTERPHLEAQAKELDKPITVRNLENAQGDERDVVLFSTTFGVDSRGRFPMTFGPLGQPGGERRLNVAITRAKKRLVVYTSFKPQDIDLSRVAGQGVRDLRSWLSFARGEHEALLIPTQNTDGAADSAFERAVRVALERLGWVVHGQVGCSGFRIDLAVVDPQNPQRYLAGVECDGATYHSIKSARDRDILRTQILEGRGWQIRRVWSTHWFRRPDAALAELHRQLVSLRDS